MKNILVASLALLLSASVFMTACSEKTTSSTETKPTASAPMSGLTKTDVKVGNGTEAVAGKQVAVHYTGWLYDENAADKKGTKFDSSLDRGTPFEFPLGGGRVIKGWDEGVVGMKVGGQRTLIIAPEYGYGARGAGGVIPPNATLLFDVELLDVK